MQFRILVTTLLLAAPAVAQDNEPPLIRIMSAELGDTMSKLAMPDGTKPYYVAYTITDSLNTSMEASLGGLVSDNQGRSRQLDVDVRIGDHKIDNTHKLRDDGDFSFGSQSSSNVNKSVSLSDDPWSIRHEIWLGTDECFKQSVQQYQKVRTNLKTMVDEEDQSDDFSKETPAVGFQKPASYELDRAAWADRLRRASAVARTQPFIYDSSVSLQATAENRYFVSSDGARLLDTNRLFTVAVTAGTKADDGMELSQYETFNCASPENLPTEEQIRAGMQNCIDQVLALRDAPLVEPYTGPAILINRAAGVFFHEIFGHRIEGHRQKDVDEGQTFTRKIGQPVLPAFLTVHDDPTRAIFGTTDLRGFYLHDDEGVAAQDALLVKDGVLQTFLLSRTPVQTFEHSNGHGRRNPGNDIVARQGNLMVESTNSVPFAKLREMLVEECHKQGKPYGLLFEDISGGFTNTNRGSPQAFKVLPIVVYRVYGDGRPDELVRGVDIVGTPLACFSRIIATGDDPDVFNGTCGAESGWVPVSATSPSILVSEIEVEKRHHEQDRPPILPAPDVPGSTPAEKRP